MNLHDIIEDLVHSRIDFAINFDNCDSGSTISILDAQGCDVLCIICNHDGDVYLSNGPRNHRIEVDDIKKLLINLREWYEAGDFDIPFGNIH